MIDNPGHHTGPQQQVEETASIEQQPVLVDPVEEQAKFIKTASKFFRTRTPVILHDGEEEQMVLISQKEISEGTALKRLKNRESIEVRIYPDGRFQMVSNPMERISFPAA